LSDLGDYCNVTASTREALCPTSDGGNDDNDMDALSSGAIAGIVIGNKILYIYALSHVDT